MTTSPDERPLVSPPLMTTFVVPTVLAGAVHDFLTQHCMAVARREPDEQVFVAVPNAEFARAMSDVSGRYRVEWDESFHPPRLIDTEAVVDVWTPALDVVHEFTRETLGDRLVPLTSVLDLPVVEGWTGDCSHCGHIDLHHAVPYVDPRKTTQRLITFCTHREDESFCPCRLVIAS